jgi:PAS domain S-box-containing protein
MKKNSARQLAEQGGSESIAGLIEGARAGRLPSWQAYLFAVVATTATLGLRLALDAPLGGQPTLVIFALPIMLSAYVGGLRAGLLATALSYLAASYYLLPPLYSFQVSSGPERWQQFFVALAGVVISVLNEGLHRARRRADIAMRENRLAEERVGAALKETGDLRAALDEHAIVAITDPQGRITYVNEKFCSISKYSRQELLGQDHRIINSSFHTKEFIRGLWTTIANGQVWHGEIKNRAKDGSSYWVDTTIVPFLNEQGKPRQYVAIRADITERKRSEDELRKSLREVNDLKAALDEHAIVAMTDSQGRITFVNDKFCAISKYSRQELLGQDHRIINSAFHSKEFIGDLWTTITHGKVWHGEIKNRAKDGSFYWVDTTIVPFLGEQGKPRQYVAIRADITERKRAEEEIQQLNAELEERVVTRTVELERASLAKDRFLASMSHELRTPLNAVIGFTGTLLMGLPGPLTSEQKRQLTTIRSSAEHQLSLINDLLDLAKIESGKVELNLEPIGCKGVIDEVAETLRPLAEKKGLEFEVDASKEITIDTDRRAFSQILINLINNAIKFTQSGKILVELQSKDGATEVSVRDSGVGIELEDQAKLFDAFARLEHGSMGRQEGTGLGLHLSQQLAALLGGRITFESERGKGSTFTLAIEHCAWKDFPNEKNPGEVGRKPLTAAAGAFEKGNGE